MLAAALLCAALAVALGPTSTRVRSWALSALVVSAWVTYATSLDRIGLDWADGLFLACWLSIVGTASSVYLRQPIGIFAAVILALNAGMLSGAITALTSNGSVWATLGAVSAVVVLWPVGWAARRQVTVPVKVVSSWLMAVAVLAAVLQFLPVTPGYLPDHVE